MKTLTVCAALFVAAGALAYARAAAVAPAATQFMTQFRLTALKDGKRTVLAEPNVVTEQGRQGAFFTGGEVPVDAEGKEVLPFGITSRVKVREEAADKLRVSMYLGYSQLDTQSASNFVIREQGVYCVRTVKPDEKVELDLGEGLIAAFSVKPFDAKQ